MERDEAAITACALMIKGICLTAPSEEWTALIKKRIQYMLKQTGAQQPAQAGERPEPSDIQGWSVTVNVNAQDILTIGHNSLSGIDGIEDFAPVVRNCAEHLLSFIGNPAQSAPVLDDERAKDAVRYARYLADSACDNGDSREYVKPMLDAILAAIGAPQSAPVQTLTDEAEKAARELADSAQSNGDDWEGHVKPRLDLILRALSHAKEE